MLVATTVSFQIVEWVQPVPGKHVDVPSLKSVWRWGWDVHETRTRLPGSKHLCPVKWAIEWSTIIKPRRNFERKGRLPQWLGSKIKRRYGVLFSGIVRPDREDSHLSKIFLTPEESQIEESPKNLVFVSCSRLDDMTKLLPMQLQNTNGVHSQCLKETHFELYC